MTQTLDERQASQGKLMLEVKATVHGLVPDLDRLLALEPEGFEVVKVDDQGVSVSKFEPEMPGSTILSERLWTLTLRAQGEDQPPAKFSFGKVLAENTTMHYQRYDDADLRQVDAVVEMEQTYGQRRVTWPWWAAGGAAILAGVGALAWRLLRRRRAPCSAVEDSGAADAVHDHRAAGTHREGRGAERVAKGRGRRGDPQNLEKHFFAAGESNGQVDLAEVAGNWVRRAAG